MEPQEKYRFGMVGNTLLEGLKQVLLYPILRLLQWFEIIVRVNVS